MPSNPTCRPARHGHHRWRAVPDRHVPWHAHDCPEDDCPGCADHPDGCEGCEPCPRTHCAVCRRRHLNRRAVCVRCVGRTRTDLELIAERLVFAAELVDGWPASTALEPVTAGCGSRGDETPLPVGDLGAMLLDGSRGDEEDGTTWRRDDPMPVRWLLRSWAEDWAERFGDLEPVTTPRHYLWTHLERAAGEHPAFSDFAGEIYAVRVELDVRTREAERERTGVPCPYCGDKLIRPDDDPDPCPSGCPHTGHGHDQGGRRDYWQCRNTRCRRRYSREAHSLAIWQAWHERRQALSNGSETERVPSSA